MSSAAAAPQVVYPDDDGKPMSDNTVQYRWIVTLQGNLDLLFRGQPDVFVAGNHLIYAQEGNPKRRVCPDVYVAVGRPKRDRGSYKLWEEAVVFPQVVFEVLSPGNRPLEMARKFRFYERYGAEEYYLYDPDRADLQGFLRTPAGLLRAVRPMHGHVSPRLGIRFDTSGTELAVVGPDGRRFLTFLELGDLALQAETERQRADTERREKERLAAKLRELGLDPDAL